MSLTLKLFSSITWQLIHFLGLFNGSFFYQIFNQSSSFDRVLSFHTKLYNSDWKIVTQETSLNYESVHFKERSALWTIDQKCANLKHPYTYLLHASLLNAFLQYSYFVFSAFLLNNYCLFNAVFCWLFFFVAQSIKGYLCPSRKYPGSPESGESHSRD